ncbi:MAG: hypothetical protein AB2L07_02355 [Thermoanaerobaculaceae bacterium]
MAKKGSTGSGLGLSRIHWALLLAAWLVLGNSSAGAGCGPWEMLSPHPHGRNLADVVWGGDRFVAVGYSVTQWSLDGVTWEIAIHDGTHLNAVAWTGAAFVAVGDGGVILTSPDGVSWSPVQSPTSADLTGIAWGGGELVTVSESRQAFRSADGLAWDLLPIPPPQGALRGVVHADGGFCIFGDAGTVIVGSGTSWAPLGGANHSYLDIVSMAVLGGRYYVQAGGQLKVLDGAQWTDLPRFPYGSLLGREGGRLNIVVDRWAYSSPDGTTWTSEPGLGSRLPVRALAMGPERAVAVGDYGASLLRANGTAWELTSGAADQLIDIASNGRILVLATRSRASDSCRLLSSFDGREWTCRATGYSSTSHVAWIGDRFVAFTWPNDMSWSPDGVTWTSPSTVSTTQLPLDIVSFRGRYLAFVGFGGYGCPVTCDPGWAEVLASTDLESWQSVWHDESKVGLISVASNGSRLVATRCCQEQNTGRLDGFVASDDGETWTPVSVSEELPRTTRIVWTGSRFVAAGGRVVMESADGLSWSVISRPSFSIHDLGWAGNVLVAAGTWESYPLVASSRDGRIWDSTYPFVQPRQPPTMPVSVESYGMSSIQSVGGNPRLQIAVGANGTLLRRECEPEPTVPRRRLGRGSGASQP